MDFLEPFLRYLKMMPQQDDLSLIVLKGHLLIEERLERVLQAAFPNPEHLDAMKLQFARKVQLCRAVSRGVSDSTAWSLINCINVLRNNLAWISTVHKPANNRGWVGG
jgi:hypothetical protein